MPSPLIPKTFAPALEARAVSTARRLMSGCGTASFVAYHHDAERSIGALAHALSATGQLVVACLESDAAKLPEGAFQVRFDLRREAADAQVRILAATAHLLGSMQWLIGQERVDASESGLLPESVALLTSAPNVRLGVVRTERVLVHDGSGVTPVTLEALLGCGDEAAFFPSPEEEVDVYEAVACTPQRDLVEIVRATVSGHLSGCVLSSRPIDRGWEYTPGRMYCVDVDAFGINLMLTSSNEARIVFVPFTTPARDVGALRERLSALVRQARP